MRNQAAVGTALLALAALLGGCSLPANFQIASWALDGISYLVTKKSVTDHGLSLVAQKDCALWRGLSGEDICSDYDTGDIMVADAALPPADGGDGDGSNLADFATASGTAQVEEPPADAPAPMADPAPAASGDGIGALGDFPGNPPKREIAAAQAPLAVPVEPVEVAALAPPPAGGSGLTRPARPDAGANKEFLYVIGSYSRRGNATRQAGRYAALGPAVFAAVAGGARVYRVVVGPFARGQGGEQWRRIAAAGIRDAWTVRANPADRFVARYAGLAARPGAAPPRAAKPSSVRVVAAIPEATHRVSITIGPVLATASGPAFPSPPGA